MKIVLRWVIGISALIQTEDHYAMGWKSHMGSTLVCLEKDWQEGGNEAQQYDLDRFCCNGCCGSIFAQAIVTNKPSSFIEYLITCGAQVQQNKTYTVTEYRNGCIIPATFLSDSLAMASCSPNIETMRILIKHGGLEKLDTSDKNSLLIRFIRESKQKAIDCLEYLIDEGCPVESDADHLSEIAYVSIPGQDKTYCKKLTSPLIEAVGLRIPEVMKLLLEASANPNKKYGGKSAWEVAQAKNWSQRIGSRLGKAKPEEKNLLEQSIDSINAEKEIINREKAKLLAEDDKRQIQSTRLIKCITNNTKLIDIDYLVSLQRR